MREYGRLNLVWAELAGNAPAPPLPLLHPPGCSYPSLSGEAKVAPAPQGYCPWGKGAVLQFIHFFFHDQYNGRDRYETTKKETNGQLECPRLLFIVEKNDSFAVSCHALFGQC